MAAGSRTPDAAAVPGEHTVFRGADTIFTAGTQPVPQLQSGELTPHSIGTNRFSGDPSRSVNRNWAPGRGLSFRTITRIPSGQPDMSIIPVNSATHGPVALHAVGVVGRCPRLGADPVDRGRGCPRLGLSGPGSGVHPGCWPGGQRSDRSLTQPGPHRSPVRQLRPAEPWPPSTREEPIAQSPACSFAVTMSSSASTPTKTTTSRSRSTASVAGSAIPPYLPRPPGSRNFWPSA